MDFCIVSAENLRGTPKAFQDYVEKCFREETILGQKCFVAFCDPARFYPCITKNDMVPSHSLFLDQFTDGLPGKKDLCRWIDDENRKSPDERLIDKINLGSISPSNPIYCDE